MMMIVVFLEKSTDTSILANNLSIVFIPKKLTRCRLTALFSTLYDRGVHEKPSYSVKIISTLKITSLQRSSFQAITENIISLKTFCQPNVASSLLEPQFNIDSRKSQLYLHIALFHASILNVPKSIELFYFLPFSYCADLDLPSYS